MKKKLSCFDENGNIVLENNDPNKFYYTAVISWMEHKSIWHTKYKVIYMVRDKNTKHSKIRKYIDREKLKLCGKHLFQVCIISGYRTDLKKIFAELKERHYLYDEQDVKVRIMLGDGKGNFTNIQELV